MKQLLYLVLTAAVLFSSCSGPNTTTTVYYDLTNTTWEISYPGKKFKITFLNNGQLKTNDKNDRSWRNHGWKQKDHQLVFHFNNRYAIYKGVLLTRI